MIDICAEAGKINPQKIPEILSLVFYDVEEEE